MSELVKICPTSDVADNSVKSFEVGNNVIAVYNLAAGGDEEEFVTGGAGPVVLLAAQKF